MRLAKSLDFRNACGDGGLSERAGVSLCYDL